MSTSERAPGRRHLLLAILIPAGAVILVGAIIAVVAVVVIGGSDAARIDAVTKRLATAVATDDRAGLYASLCSREVDALRADLGDDDALSGGTPTPAAGLHVASVTVTDVRTHGSTRATATVRRGTQRPQTVYYLEERGDWKVCQSLDTASRQGPPVSG